MSSCMLHETNKTLVIDWKTNLVTRLFQKLFIEKHQHDNQKRTRMIDACDFIFGSALTRAPELQSAKMGWLCCRCQPLNNVKHTCLEGFVLSEAKHEEIHCKPTEAQNDRWNTGG